MGYINIPLRPDNDSEFSPMTRDDKDIIVYAVLTNCSNQIAFMRFHPEFTTVVGGTGKPSLRLNNAGKTECKHFWSYPKHRSFRESYERTVEEFLGKKNRVEVAVVDESRKDKALKNLLNQAMSLVEDTPELDADTLKVCTDIFNRLGLISAAEEKVEAPRRYLPVRCVSECQYRAYVESAIDKGQMINECEYCKALEVAREHGYRYDPASNLRIPESEIKPLNTFEND